MQKFERDYAALVNDVMLHGIERMTRNGRTQSRFGAMLKVPVYNTFPLIQGRKMYPKGVFGELAAILRRPKHINDFKTWGCNYWDTWAKEDGSINVDYGNTWFDFNGVDQIAKLKDQLANDPYNRRMIIAGWKPNGLEDLDLPCCHYNYQFYVDNFNTLHMLWSQRSVDLMVGLPSDIVFAAAWLIAIANEFGMNPGFITFSLGDCHVYQEHYTAAETYVDRVVSAAELRSVSYTYHADDKDFTKFKPSYIKLGEYQHFEKLDLELKA